MIQECVVSGALVRKPTSDLLLHLLSNPIERDNSFPDAFHPASFSSKESAWTAQTSPMMSSMEPQSFTARRPATSSLPAFSLPSPTDHLSHPRYPAYAASAVSQPPPATLSSVLTPPGGLASDLSPLASSVSGSSGSSSQGVPPYQPSLGYWPTPHQPSYSYSQAPSMPAPFAQSQQPYSFIRQSPLYSPSLNFPSRNINSPTAGEGLPPPYDVNLPFPTPMTGGGQSQNQSPPSLAPRHSHQRLGPQNPQQQQGQQQQMSSNELPAASQPSQQSPLHAPDTYGGRPHSNSSYYTPSSTPQQSSFPAYAQQSPTQQSPMASSAPSNRLSPSHSYHQPYRGYSLPAMTGPIMTNVHNPGSQMALVGGMNMQGYPHHQDMYDQHSHGQSPLNDRPFKCDHYQCSQSFNRNHDLKRHKRIHLAVKPYPCGHCEKSFSRKDALKRHILVKGCGKGAAGGAANVGRSHSPVDKSEVMSDATEEASPEMTKKALT